eukprot:g5783.t1
MKAVTTCLFPLTVIKTRQIANPSVQPGFQGASAVASEVWRNEGIRGFYKGFGTVVVGTIPSRIVYISTLEIVRNGLSNSLHHLGLSDVALSGSVNLVAGASASMMTQTVFVPIDVISQRLMVLNNKPNSALVKMNGLSMGRMIIQQEGIRGLWKGFFASISTYVPNSAIWWASYGAIQKQIWNSLEWWKEQSPQQFGCQADIKSQQNLPKINTEKLASVNEVIMVQTSAALLSGMTSALMTTPLDVIKTRTQLQVHTKGTRRLTTVEICQDILKSEGISGFLRGLAPRAANVAMWGTCMVSVYEFLKRVASVQ